MSPTRGLLDVRESAVKHSDWRTLDADQVARRLNLPANLVPWLQGLKPFTDDGRLLLPDDAEAKRLLVGLGVDPAAASETLAARPSAHEHAALWWLLERLYADTLAEMGACVPVEGFSGWPTLPDSSGTVGRHAYVWLLLALVPHVRRVHSAPGIRDGVSWSNLGMLGETMRVHRRLTGTYGLGGLALWSPPLRFRGADYQLGRLEFNRVEIALANGVCGWALNVHIPAGEPLTPASCDEAFTAARDFFSQHFADEPTTFFTCSSWLLDPQLADYLPATSNIVQFQQRFHLVPIPTRADGTYEDHVLLEYLFSRLHDQPVIPTGLLDVLPQATTLQRAYLTHLRAGRHWRCRTGWFPASSTAPCIPRP